MTAAEAGAVPSPTGQHLPGPYGPADGWVQRGLAALTIALLPLGNLVTVQEAGRSFPIPLAWLPTVLLVIHFALTSLSGRPDQWGDRRTWPHLISVVLAVALALALPLFLAVAFWSGAAAYLNFILGVFGGVAVGWVWSAAPPDRLGVIDLSLLFFLSVGALQILAANLSAPGLRAEIVWGRSNFVSGVLVVGSLLAVARIRATRAPRAAYLPPLAAVAMSLSTQSRGAVVALALGVIVLLWNIEAEPRLRRLLRIASVAVPAVALTAILVFTQARLVADTQALRNVSFRFELIAMAWSEFVGSPLFGTGWVSLRSASLEAGAENSFAHNFVLSFLQIGGVIGLVFVVLFSVLVLLALRRRELYAAPIAAATGIALTDPFLESFIGGIIVFSAVLLALSTRGSTQPAPQSAPGSG